MLIRFPFFLHNGIEKRNEKTLIISCAEGEDKLAYLSTNLCTSRNQYTRLKDFRPDMDARIGFLSKLYGQCSTYGASSYGPAQYSYAYAIQFSLHRQAVVCLQVNALQVNTYTFKIGIKHGIKRFEKNYLFEKTLSFCRNNHSL